MMCSVKSPVVIALSPKATIDYVQCGISPGAGKDGSGLRDLETQVASCGSGSDSENICTYAMDLQQVTKGIPVQECLQNLFNFSSKLYLVLYSFV